MQQYPALQLQEHNSHTAIYFTHRQTITVCTQNTFTIKSLWISLRERLLEFHFFGPNL